MSTTKTRTYRVPSYTPDVDSVSLSNFDIDEVREYVHRYDTGALSGAARAPQEVDAQPGELALVISLEDLDRIRTLALCGQAEHARAFVLRLVSDHIGRLL